MFLTAAQASFTLGVSSCTPHRRKITAFRSPGVKSRRQTLNGNNSSSSLSVPNMNPEVASTSRGTDYVDSHMNLIECSLKLNSAKFVVLSQDGSSNNVQDILAINTVFVCRMQGRRAASKKNKTKKQQQQMQEIRDKLAIQNVKEGQSDPIPKDQSVPKFLTENIIETMDGLVYNMVVANFNYGHLSTCQFWFRTLLKLKISYTH
ncbi:hypothetical protein Glove_134g177 [Diversispora epigaea]|uniref:Uncharacterized protein n=1 Tax=Diversispora epigaea TaxID=1348612 RepID=A0A397J6U9_9GLOM|nr:hypothetical protein Glove_134g177 [Diversispora epigaea]